jgi:hypothetical protein
LLNESVKVVAAPLIKMQRLDYFESVGVGGSFFYSKILLTNYSARIERRNCDR